VIVDTSVLFAAANRRDSNHSSCRAIVVEGSGTLTIPALVLAEASYLIGTALGPSAETALLRSMVASRFEVIGPTREDLLRMAELASKYEDLPLGATDASIVALAERLNDSTIATLDRRHFTVVKSELASLVLLPENIEPSRR
jgi:uncharacterized protein